MEKRPVQFYSDGIALAGDLYVPDLAADASAARPAIILCHGFGAIKEVALPNLAAPLVEGGYVVLGFDHRGFGLSGGVRWRLIPMEQVRDIRDGITFLQNLPEVDANRIGAYGISFGGSNAVTAAGTDERLKCIVSQTPVSDGRAWMQSLRRRWEWIKFLNDLQEDAKERVVTGKSRYIPSDEMTPPDPHTGDWRNQVLRDFPQRAYEVPLESAERIIEYRPIDYVAKIGTRPTLFLTVCDDEIVPTEQAVALYEAALEPKQLHIFQDSHHGMYEGESLTKAGHLAVSWFNEYL
jgi:dipeptidyl aminopeptidase/acylaminoacyl peptidase